MDLHEIPRTGGFGWLTPAQQASYDTAHLEAKEFHAARVRFLVVGVLAGRIPFCIGWFQRAGEAACLEPRMSSSDLQDAMGVELNRPVRANREKAMLSACFTWLRRQPGIGLKSNPCFGIRRNPEEKRERYVTHDEYRAVWAKSHKSVRALLDLIYRTLQRPEDIIGWGPANVITKTESDGRQVRVIRNDQGKTGAIVDIAITPEIDAIFATLKPKSGIEIGPGRTYIANRDNESYTYSGLAGMLRRYIKKSKVNDVPVPAFGFYDMKGKGATDMWLSGEPLEKIQVLCGHDSITTTEIYVKSRWRDTVQPNATIVKMA